MSAPVRKISISVVKMIRINFLIYVKTGVQSMIIKKISASDYANALSLVWSVFLQYEAPDYSQQGIDAFRAAITDRKYLGALEMWGAYLGEYLIGVIALRNGGNHIALFFVDGAYHRKGIGRALFNTALTYSTGDVLTVNSSPYAVNFYRRLGFVPNSAEQLTNGIRYTPMAYTKHKK